MRLASSSSSCSALVGAPSARASSCWRGPLALPQGQSQGGLSHVGTCMAERFNMEIGHGQAWHAISSTVNRQWAAVGAVLAGRFYACGGFDGVQSLNFAGRFDPELECWEVLPAMLERRWAATGAVLGSCLYVCGGRDGRRTLSSAERLDPELGRWEALPDMCERRWAASCAALAGQLYVCGGCSDHRSLSSCEQFLPESSCVPWRCGLGWEPLPDMLQLRGAVKCAAVAGKIYVSGTSGGQHWMSTLVERFDPERGCWESLPATSALRLETAAPPAAGRLHILGGPGKLGCLAASPSDDLGFRALTKTALRC